MIRRTAVVRTRMPGGVGGAASRDVPLSRLRPADTGGTICQAVGVCIPPAMVRQIKSRLLHMIVAQMLTNQDAGDPSRVGPLLSQIAEPISQVTADGAYDGDPMYQTIATHGDDIKVVIPPRATAVPSSKEGSLPQRDRHLTMITEQGRLAWQAATGYGQRTLVEPTMGRYKSLIGPRLRARGFAAQ